MLPQNTAALRRAASSPNTNLDKRYRAAPAEVAAALANQMEALARGLICREPSSRSGYELRWGRKGSLAVHIGGPKRGRFFDNEAQVCGDALALVAHLRRCSMGEAYRWALGWLGMEGRLDARTAPQWPKPAEPNSPVGEQASSLARRKLAARLWREALPAAGTPVECYLTGRGLSLPPTDLFSADPADLRNAYPLRFHPACPRGAERLPAMVALMTDPVTGAPQGLHRTFLAPDGVGKSSGQTKMMLGGAGVVCLVPEAEVVDGLGVAEGIETSLAIMQRYGWTPVWATGSAGGIARFPVLPGIEALTVFPDADDSGASLTAAQRCAERWRAAGREVDFIPAPDGADFADLTGRAA
ncbi:DUF7146 domain-containing protein [Paracraurococcus lichenis]|uniref:Toprim domain-containing protein n=1 Tax=Paracraurococcus lichenis TaxID=3064888 RepID=A0ABT9EAU1_9PROT|nr:toprim domain-containing protein [Paracraurococcus sp. LOR1-02]MDO9713321.1 toprim domain-containing protein [Paracraurococcus sp. LOR1-02]